MAVAALCTEFPLILPSLDFRPPKSFHGFITISDGDHEILISTPYFPSIRGMTLKTGVTLSSLIERCRPELQKIEKESYSVVEYLKKFQQICNSANKEHVSSSEVPLPQDSFFSSLIEHLEVVGWSKISEVSPDFSSVTLQTSDNKGRLHTLKVRIQPGYPDEEPVVEANLPKEFKFSWSSVEGLSGIMSAWEEQILGLQQFWDVLDELDETAVVLDPPDPERRHTARRILLSNHVSVQLSVSVDHPSSLPQCHFLGSSSLTTPLNKCLTEKYQDWDPERSLVNNIELILGVEVVKRSAQSGNGDEEWSAECAVCYCLHLDGSLPDLTCDHCSQSFHITCLYEWLHGLPNSRQSMNFIFGECPYCTQLISCKVPE